MWLIGACTSRCPTPNSVLTTRRHPRRNPGSHALFADVRFVASLTRSDTPYRGGNAGEADVDSEWVGDGSYGGEDTASMTREGKLALGAVLLGTFVTFYYVVLAAVTYFRSASHEPYHPS